MSEPREHVLFSQVKEPKDWASLGFFQVLPGRRYTIGVDSPRVSGVAHVWGKRRAVRRAKAIARRTNGTAVVARLDKRGIAYVVAIEQGTTETEEFLSDDPFDPDEPY